MDKVNNNNRLTNNHLKQLVIKTCRKLWMMIMLAAISTTAAATTTISYYHNDHLGTPQVLTDENQNVVWQADYDPFGKANITTETITNNIRFPGQYFDEETGLHYNYFRYYDPNIGRYITSDPIGLDGGVNTYGYALQNPLIYTDPTGEVTGAAALPVAEACLSNPYCAGTLGAGLGVSLACIVNPDLCETIVKEACSDLKELFGPLFDESADADRITKQRENRRKRRERESRKRNGQNQSGEGSRDHESANKGPRGKRPTGSNDPRKRRDTTSPHADGFNTPGGIF